MFNKKILGPCMPVLALTLGILLAGCASAPGGNPGSPDGTPSVSTTHDTQVASATQAQALADDVVSQDEYREGFNRLESCMKENGAELVNVDETGVIITYSYLTSAEKTHLTCYMAEFSELDRRWQLENENYSESTKLLRECLIANGIEPSKDATVVANQIADAKIDVATCLK